MVVAGFGSNGSIGSKLGPTGGRVLLTFVRRGHRLETNDPVPGRPCAGLPARDKPSHAYAVKKPTHGWRGGRVAEGGGLLNRYTVNIRIVGSNPIPSATQPSSHSYQ